VKLRLVVLFAASAALYLPTARAGFVQDDRAIIASSPAAHSIPAALRAFRDPYWPRESGAGLYRPVTILSYAVDWTISGGSAGWLHVMNAIWHGLVVVLFMLILVRWLSPAAAAAAAFIFAWHPVHVEAVASLVGRAELLAAAAILGAVLAARRGRWVLAVLCTALAMFSKEHGVIAPVVILLDWWLQGAERRHYPLGLWIGMAGVTALFLALWLVIGSTVGADVAAVFHGRSALERWLVALPAIARALLLLFWPLSLSVEYGPRVIPAYETFAPAALVGLLVVFAMPALIWRAHRGAPAIAFGAGLTLLSYLPTANLIFASGVVLAERNLYLAVALPSVLAGAAVAWWTARTHARAAVLAAAVISALLGARAFARLPAWRDNRAQLITLLAEHPESYRGHASAAAVLAGTGDTAGARRQYVMADSLFSGDAAVTASYAIYLIDRGDTAGAVPLMPRLEARDAYRARFLVALRRGDRSAAVAVADSALGHFSGDKFWYARYLQ
jgi:protein O-mannosyl-transferase